MFLKDMRTEEHVFLLRQENMRTRGRGEGLLEQKENMRFGWALPNTRCLRILT